MKIKRRSKEKLINEKEKRIQRTRPMKKLCEGM